MKTIEEEFAEVLKAAHEGVEAGDNLVYDELTAKIQEVQAKHCAMLYRRKVLTILNTIKWCTVEDVLEVIEGIYDDEE